jgi:hypothetical protein
MLTIRPEQMRVLGLALQERFSARMAKYLRRVYAKYVANWSDEQLFGLIEQATTDARDYGITAERDVARYIGYAVTYGREFHLKPWAAGILETPKINGTQKMDRLDAYDLFAGRSGAG